MSQRLPESPPRQPSPSYAASEPLQPHTLHGNSYNGIYARKERRFRIACRVLWRWALTAFFAAAIFALLIHYSQKPVMSKPSKYRFNAITTGVSIALGLAIAKSLDVMVGDLRWWILSRRYRPRHEVELILQADSMLRLIKLAAKSRRIFVYMCVLLWLVVIIGSQVAVASLGLLYSVESAKKQALMVPGEVLLPNMTTFATDRDVSTKPAALGAQQYVANNYGIISTAYVQDELSDIPPEGTLWSPGDPLIFCDDSCAYAFHEESIKSREKYNAEPLVVITSRTIEATAVCNSWKVKEGGDGSGANITVATENGDKRIAIPIAGGIDQTLYMINTTQGCGSGCSGVSAFEASLTAPWYYECNITVGQVANATRPEHKASVDFMTIASGAIALQGYGASSLVEETNLQFQSYPAETVFGLPMEGNVNGMAVILSRFTVGVIASAAERNNKIVVQDKEPERGSQLTISHPSMIIGILVLVALVQLVLDAAVQTWANRVVVPRGGSMALAQVLRPMVISQTNPGPSSTMDDAFMPVQNDESLWIYRNKAIGDGFFELYMEESRTDTRQDHNGIELGFTTQKPAG